MKFINPKLTKFKKIRKGKLVKNDFKNSLLTYGTIGLKCLQSGLIKSYQIETFFNSLKKKLKKKAKIWIKFSFSTSITAKPLESRMGKGKGSVKYFAFKVSAGSILLEACFQKNTKSSVIRALTEIQYKIPVKTLIVEC